MFVVADYDYTYERDFWENPNQTVLGNTDAPAFPWNTVDKIAIHYTGAIDVPDGDPDELPWEQHVGAYLRAIQNDYVTNRGYSIGYGVLVAQDGSSWQLRGVDRQNAANKGVNAETFTILVFVDGNDPVSDAAKKEIRKIVSWYRQESGKGKGVKIVGHRDIGATACPGEGVYAQIRAGEFEPMDEPVEDIMKREMIIQPPAEREGGPFFYLCDGNIRYAVPADVAHVRNIGGEVYKETVERYDLLCLSVFGMIYDSDIRIT